MATATIKLGLGAIGIALIGGAYANIVVCSLPGNETRKAVSRQVPISDATAQAVPSPVFFKASDALAAEGGAASAS